MTQETNGSQGNSESVSCIDAAFRKSAGMGFFTGVMHMKCGAGNNSRINDIHRNRMNHHRGMHVGECASF